MFLITITLLQWSVQQQSFSLLCSLLPYTMFKMFHLFFLITKFLIKLFLITMFLITMYYHVPDVGDGGEVERD